MIYTYFYKQKYIMYVKGIANEIGIIRLGVCKFPVSHFGDKSF